MVDGRWKKGDKGERRGDVERDMMEKGGDM